MALILFFFSIVFIVAYCLLSFVLKSFIKTSLLNPCSTPAFLSKVSVLIAAKNEEANLPNLIKSLKQQDTNDLNYEIILLNDASTDNTLELMQKLTKDDNHFIIIDCKEKKYPGKKGALQIGFEKSNGETILITDADCTPEPGWIKTLALKLNSGIDLVFGVAPFYYDSGLVNKIARYENFKSSILTFSFALFNLPYSATARSFGYKREIFIKNNGFKEISQTLSGDDDLFLNLARKNNFKISPVLSFNCKVYSQASKNLKSYNNQKKRHLSTSAFYPFDTKFLLATWHIINLLAFFSFMLIYFSNYFILITILKLLLDFSLISLFEQYFGYKFTLFEKIYLSPIYEIFVIYNYVNSRFTNHKNYEWK